MIAFKDNGDIGGLVLNYLLQKTGEKIQYSNEGTVVITSNWYSNHSNTGKKHIYYSGEGYFPPSYESDGIYALTTSAPVDNYMYIPYALFSGHIYKERKYGPDNRPYLVMYCNSNCVTEREHLYNLFVETNEVCHAGGRCCGNYPNTTRKCVKNGWGDEELIDLYKDYKFVFAMENKRVDSYVTEKIVNAFYSGAIPIYWGSSNVKELFNSKAFIDVSDFESFEKCVEYVVHMSEETRIKMSQEPIYTNNDTIQLMNDKVENKTRDEYVRKLKQLIHDSRKCD